MSDNTRCVVDQGIDQETRCECCSYNAPGFLPRRGRLVGVVSEDGESLSYEISHLGCFLWVL